MADDNEKLKMPTNREVREIMLRAVTDVIPENDDRFDGELGLEVSKRTSEGMLRVLAINNPEHDFDIDGIADHARNYARVALEERLDDVLPDIATIERIMGAPS